MARPAESKDVFPFFKLPREMRDEIYDHALVTAECKQGTRGTYKCGKHPDGDCVWFKVLHIPSSKLLSICRQFNQEYKEKATKRSQLVVTEMGPCLTLFESQFDFPKRTKNFARLHIQLHALHVDDIEAHHDWLTDVLPGMRNLQHLSVRIDMERHYNHEEQWLAQVKVAQEQLNKLWTKLPYLRALQIRETNELYTWEDSSPVIMELSKQTGRVQFVESV